MLFIVHIDITTPSDVSPERLDRLKRAEKEQAGRLADDGRLHRLWRDATKWGNWGLWEADDEDALLAEISTLPLRRFMTVELHPVIDHPSDPALRPQPQHEES